ncbi:hypothetical protein PV10_05194 [Exophiala mesophila]|uniref:Proteasome maturation factor UMP1 n=1 Tax=Exophiala mesophila TaxID=212818 RepID=A0A0D1Y0N8_EXOME|nr:uncharacterized protein PV10_05194 [Exophiala mesophila]KIV94036.1 hypothetical protein PV10_05194 [Exophiala mesophila]
MSLRIAPSASHPSSTSNTTTSKLTSTTTTTSSSTPSTNLGAPSAPGLHDTLRAAHTHEATTTITSSHPLESRLQNWTRTQERTQMNLMRRNFGLAEPLRRGMELKMVRDADSFRPSVLGAPSRLHDDILTGRDTAMDWEDVYAGQDGLKMGLNQGGDGQGVGWTEEMERKVGMGKW